MPASSNSSLFRVGFALAILVELAGCTPGGQFDPTEMFNSDMFDTKKKLQGQREPVFPNGVPGTTTGVPADLVKGYQPPPDQADATTIPPAPAPAAEAEAEAAKPKPKPKPKVASAPPQNPNSVWNQKAAGSASTRISVGSKPAPSPAQQQTPSSQAPWPASGATQQQTPSAQAPWPAQTAPAQSSQSVWPNPPATGTSTQ